VLTVACVGAIAVNRLGMTPQAHGVLRLTAWISGFLALLSAVHWSPRIYSRWMRAAGVMNLVTTTVLLGACYFLIVPLFWAIVQLRRGGRRLRGVDTYWHQRRRVEPDLRYFQRMG
jgi:hypothetical protein